MVEVGADRRRMKILENQRKPVRYLIRGFYNVIKEVLMALIQLQPTWGKDNDDLQLSYQSSMLRGEGWYKWNLGRQGYMFSRRACFSLDSKCFDIQGMGYFATHPWVSGSLLNGVLLVRHFSCGVTSYNPAKRFSWTEDYSSVYEDATGSVVALPTNQMAGLSLIKALQKAEMKVIFCVTDRLAQMLKACRYTYNCTVPFPFAGAVVNKQVMSNRPMTALEIMAIKMYSAKEVN